MAIKLLQVLGWGKRMQACQTLSNYVHKHTIGYQPVWDFVMSVSASQICPKPEQQKQQGSARLRTLYRCAGLVLQDPGAVRVIRVEARKSHSNQCMCTATCIPNAITLREPTAQTTILYSTKWQGHSVPACGCQTNLNPTESNWRKQKDSQISNFCWHVSFGGGSQDEYRARSKPRSCKVMNDTPRQYRKRRSLTVTFFPLRNLFLRVLRPAGCHKVTISHRQDPNRTMSYHVISRSWFCWQWLEILISSQLLTLSELSKLTKTPEVLLLCGSGLAFSSLDPWWSSACACPVSSIRGCESRALKR